MSPFLSVNHIINTVQHEMRYTCFTDDIGGISSTGERSIICNSSTNLAWNFRNVCSPGKYGIQHTQNTFI